MTLKRYIDEYNKMNPDSFLSWMFSTKIDLVESLYNEYLDYSIGKKSEVPDERKPFEIDFELMRKVIDSQMVNE